MQSASVSAVAETQLFPPEQLFEFSVRVFRHMGVPEEDARTAATVLQAADLRGIDSHGVARLHTYFDLLQAGRIDPKPTVTSVRESPSTATVDGGNGLGLVVGPKANAIAMEKALAVGSGWVSVRNTNHYGIAGYYVLEALKRDLIGWSMTNATKTVAPLWGAERMLGTNPLAIAFPGLEEPPIVIDMATSAAAYGKIEIARRAGKSIPLGWAIDRSGAPTTDPNAMIEGGAQLPLGSDRDGGSRRAARHLTPDRHCSLEALVGKSEPLYLFRYNHADGCSRVGPRCPCQSEALPGRARGPSQDLSAGNSALRGGGGIAIFGDA